MTMAVAAAVLVGVLWIALAFLAVALFFVLAPALGFAGAAAVTAVACLAVVGAGAAFLSWRLRQARQTALLNGLLSSGVISAVAGFAGKRPLVALGLGGVAAALWARMHKGQ